MSEKSIIEKLGMEEGADGAERVGTITIKTNYAFEADSLIHKSLCFDEMLEALIEDVKWFEESGHITDHTEMLQEWYHSRVALIEKATGKSWEQIKELL